MFQNTGTHVPESFKSQNFLGKHAPGPPSPFLFLLLKNLRLTFVLFLEGKKRKLEFCYGFFAIFSFLISCSTLSKH